ncbi:hypothetical protein [Melissospora conviva]|uniref:hypothetical protein n=1 Tax=Melissospora conviva TaxID=3388432 RepID=UPI003C20E082
MIGNIARHLAGAAGAWLVFVVQAGVVYVGLLGYAIATDTDLGGPFAGPLLVLLAAVLGAILVPLLFIPAGLVAELGAKRGRFATRLLIGFGAAATLAASYAGLIAVATDVRGAGVLWACLGGVVAVLGPTAVHVGVAYGASSARALWRRVSPVPAAGRL